MSYILEALKKAERQRENRGLEGPLTFSGGNTKGIEKKNVWPYIVMAGLFLNAAVLFFIFGPIDWGKKEEKPNPSKEVLRIEERNTGMPPVAIPDKIKTEKMQISSPEEKISTQTFSAQSVKIDKPISPEPGQMEKDTLFALEELPYSIRKDLPEFRISGHAFSEDRRTRVVRINEKILVEGQYLLPDLRLDEITRDGVIFFYKNTRFLVKLNDSR